MNESKNDLFYVAIMFSGYVVGVMLASFYLWASLPN